MPLLSLELVLDFLLFSIQVEIVFLVMLVVLCFASCRKEKKFERELVKAEVWG